MNTRVPLIADPAILQQMQQNLNNEAITRQKDLNSAEPSPVLLRSFQGHKGKVT